MSWKSWILPEIANSGEEFIVVEDGNYYFGGNLKNFLELGEKTYDVYFENKCGDVIAVEFYVLYSNGNYEYYYVLVNPKEEKETQSQTQGNSQTNENKPEIGQYVDYIPKGNDSYTVQSEYSAYDKDQVIKAEDLKWRVLSVSDNEVELISEKPTTSEVYLEGALGYNNGVTLLNNLCEVLYSNSNIKATARSYNIEDIGYTENVRKRKNLYNIYILSKYMDK